MHLVTLEAACATTDLDQALSLLDRLTPTVLAMPGCDHYVVYQSPHRNGFAVLQHWASLADFDAYRASPTFAELGQGLRPLLTKAPVTTIAHLATV